MQLDTAITVLQYLLCIDDIIKFLLSLLMFGMFGNAKL